MNIAVNWEEVPYWVVAITLNEANAMIGWPSVPRWNENKGVWQASTEGGTIKLHEYPVWTKLSAKESLQLRPAEPRFQSVTGQAILDTLSGDGVVIAGLSNVDRGHLLDLLNRVDREGR
jgi:hypothetical protein